MNRSKIFLGSAAVLLSVAGAFAKKAQTTHKYTAGFTKSTHPCASISGVRTATKSSGSALLQTKTSNNGLTTIFTNSNCSNPLYTIADN